MNSDIKANELPDEAQGELSVINAIRKLQKQLVLLEKKIDTLIEQPKGRSFNRGSNFSKPYKSHNHSHRSDQHNQKRWFDRSSGDDNRGNSRNKQRSFRGGQSNRGRNTAVIER